MSSNTTSAQQNVNPSEVGWQFVPQYYTHVNQHPQRLHMFYTKNSTFTHGTEGEEIKSCYGQQEIHQKILSIGFQDCKVFIHSVDAQASQNGGIIIQVIGEMSNHGEAWRKFAQTFFLAEQPNGYFVLNDIFRFLKEESVESDAASEADVVHAEQEPAEPSVAPAVQLQQHQQPENPPVIETFVETAPPVSLPDTAAAEAAKSKQPNGIHIVEFEETKQIEPVQELEPPVSQTIETESTHEPEPESVKEVVAPPTPLAPAPEPTPSPAAQSPVAPSNTPSSNASAVPTPAAPTAPAKPAPSAPKTWANLAASNANKWGSNVAQDARGVSAAAPAQTAASTEQTNQAQRERETSAGPSRPQMSTRPDNNHPAYQQAMSITSPSCFVKGVVETISDNLLKQTLTQRFGPIKEIEIVRFKACAFLEFERLDSAKRAIVACLPAYAGGEGGIRLDTEGGSTRISIEVKKERGDRPAPRPRGGGPGGDARGGFRGGRGGSMRGRGSGPGPAAK